MTPARRFFGSAALALVLAGLCPALQAAEPAVLVIGHAALPRLDSATVQRLYTGRAVEVAGIGVTVVNAPPGSPLRQRFLTLFLQQDDDQYRAYWTVRRHVGKGAPPRELATSAEVITFVQSTPGAVGYIDAADLRPGLNVLARP
jgi:ABC-type phosphate transport system substrate-binding protein